MNDLNELPPPPYTAIDSCPQTSISIPQIHEGNRVRNSSNQYFPSRPITRPPLELIAYTITISPASTLPSLQFPMPKKEFFKQDITELDWATFLSQLLPNLSARAYASHFDKSNEKGTAKELDQNRLRLTASEWNDLFFEPRGV